MANILEAEIKHATPNVTLTTTTETTIIESPKLPLPFHTARVIILAWAQLTTGTATTAVTARIYDITTPTPTLIGEANPEHVKAAAGSTEPFFIIVEQSLAGKESAQYRLTLAQTAATADGTCLQAAILMLLL